MDAEASSCGFWQWLQERHDGSYVKWRTTYERLWTEKWNVMGWVNTNTYGVQFFLIKRKYDIIFPPLPPSKHNLCHFNWPNFLCLLRPFSCSFNFPWWGYTPGWHSQGLREIRNKFCCLPSHFTWQPPHHQPSTTSVTPRTPLMLLVPCTIWLQLCSPNYNLTIHWHTWQLHLGEDW